MTSNLPLSTGWNDASTEWTEVLRGGDRVLIRPIHRDDVDMERRFIEGLSNDARRFRFLESMNSPSEALLRQLTAINPATDIAYVAVIDQGARNHEVGVARFSAQADGKDCEFAVVVSDGWQNKGLGTHLMWHLVQAARRRGITQMYSSDARDNELMRRFAAHLRLDHMSNPQDMTQVIYSLNLADSSRQLEA
ncbi:GNAT family N-acetyltransferase [Variovorax sp. H27-G14]|uniref:GNAT family N-acetyltransferase n=1 Tax=Variovorax sp. H27-G14 TaxID=3111914 RepID=UPI0038FC17CE